MFKQSLFPTFQHRKCIHTTKVSLLRLDENASKFIGNAVFGLIIHAMRGPELGMSVIADPSISASFLSFLDI